MASYSKLYTVLSGLYKLDELLSGRIDTISGTVSQSNHSHANKATLDTISSTDVSNWNTAYGTISGLTSDLTAANVANWKNAYTSVNETSGNWNKAYNTVNTTSGHWESAYNTISTTSSNWDNAYNKTTAISNISGNWDKAYKYVNETSGSIVTNNNITLSSLTPGATSGSSYALIVDGVQKGATIDIIKEKFLKSVEIDNNNNIIFTYNINESNNTISASLSGFVDNYTAGDNIVIDSNKKVSLSGTIPSTVFTQPVQNTLTNAVTTTDTLSANMLVVGNGNKTVKGTEYTIATSTVSGAVTGDKTIVNATAISSFVDVKSGDAKNKAINYLLNGNETTSTGVSDWTTQLDALKASIESLV